MRKIVFLFSLLMGLSSQLLAQNTYLYGVSKNNNNLYIVDTTGGYNLINTKEMYSDFVGDTIVNASFGLALSPVDDNMYIIYEPSSEGEETRRIGILDTVTAAITDVGIAGNFTDISFSRDSKLYATSGDADSYDYFEINLAEGIATRLFPQETRMYSPTIVYNYFTDQMFKFDYTTVSGINFENSLDTLYEPDLYESNTVHGIVFKNDSIAIAVGYGNFYEYNLNSNMFEEFDSPYSVSGPPFSIRMHGLSFGKLPPHIKSSGPNTFCTNSLLEPTELTASVDDAMSYQWQKDGVAIDGETTVSYIPTESGEYTCIVDGITPKTVTIVVLETPEAIFTANPEEILLGTDLTGTVEFINESTGGADTYFWDFDNGFTTTLENPSFPFTSAGTFDITLIVWNSTTTCSDTVSNTITVVNDLGIDSEFNSAFKVYPIPTNDIVNINPVSTSESYTAQLININGQLIKTIQVAANQTAQFDLNNLESGVYFIKIKTKDNSANFRIVKK